MIGVRLFHDASNQDTGDALFIRTNSATGQHIALFCSGALSFGGAHVSPRKLGVAQKNIFGKKTRNAKNHEAGNHQHPGLCIDHHFDSLAILLCSCLCMAHASARAKAFLGEQLPSPCRSDVPHGLQSCQCVTYHDYCLPLACIVNYCADVPPFLNIK